MRKIQIKKSMLGIEFNHNDCIYCGLNTDLLPEEERVVVLEENERIIISIKKYCRRCYEEGVNKKRVTARDFYINFLIGELSAEERQQREDYCEACVRKCREFSGIEIAFLHGEKVEEDEMHLDLFFDTESGEICFRTTICDDDDPWFGTELHNISPERAIELLNKNDIHIFDGLTAENWKDYSEFCEE